MIARLVGVYSCIWILPSPHQLKNNKKKHDDNVGPHLTKLSGSVHDRILDMFDILTLLMLNMMLKL